MSITQRQIKEYMKIIDSEYKGEKHPTENWARVMVAYEEGKTEKQALNTLSVGKVWKSKTEEEVIKYKPEMRQHRRIRKELVNHGILIEIPSRNRKSPYRWFPQENYGDTTPVRNSEIISRSVEEEPLIHERTSDSMRFFDEMDDRLARRVRIKSFDIIEHIGDRDSWKKRRRIRAICNKEIKPIIKSIQYLRAAGYSLSTPKEFFAKSRSSAFPRIFLDSNDLSYITGYKNLSGTILLPAPGTRVEAKDGTISMISNSSVANSIIAPSLIEWRDYFYYIAEELTEQVFGGRRIPASE